MQALLFSKLHIALALAWLGYLHTIQAQSVLKPHCETFSWTANISESLRIQAGINSSTADDIAVALNFERSNWANGSVYDDDFYRVPDGTEDAPAGALLKLQIDANTSTYTVPPSTAVSRIIFQTKTLNGSTVPASAYILWPYLPRIQPDGGGYPVIAWAHGNSGGFPNCAPSHIRNLWYQFITPYILVLQGYVVVAPDYAGLGVGEGANQRPVRHQWCTSPSHANDLFYSVQAAQSAFKVLSKQFVVVGHSQGGGAAWGAAQSQALVSVDGYLGSVAGSPVTNVVDTLGTVSVSGMNPYLTYVTALLAQSLSSIFPDSDASAILTATGLRRLALLSEIRGCDSAGVILFTGPDLVHPDWSQNSYVQKYQNLVSNGGRPVAGPLLVIHGDGDQTIPIQQTTRAVDRTCELYPQSQLEYVKLAGVSHVPAMYASQRIWLKWIEDRFAGVAVPRECHRSNFSSARPYQYYQKELNWFLSFATAGYQLA
ncbi:hypothetical protein MMC22_001293 [Lobaria immixta]|nr:hypothetical protein [Lobaria immixta]